jgi:metal-sulfur cluster biosynthetic enzyme
MITEATVRAALNAIVDPCSSAAGCPAGLDEMGLVRAVEVLNSATGADVWVVIGVTEFGCLMGAPFATAAYQHLYALPGVKTVSVELDQAFEWDLSDMSRDYRQRLQDHRARRRQIEVPIVVSRSTPSSCTNAPGTTAAPTGPTPPQDQTG